MNEADLSLSLFEAADAAPEITVLSWQGTGGKRYVTRKVLLRLPSGRRMLPDLVLVLDRAVWIIEAKGTHKESQQDDEPKLQELQDGLDPDRVLHLVQLHGGHPTAGLVPLYAVTYSSGGPQAGCIPGIRHIAWEDMLASRVTLVDCLREQA